MHGRTIIVQSFPWNELMQDDGEIPAWPYSRWEYAGLYFLGILAGMFFSAIGLAVLLVSVSSTNTVTTAISLCVMVAALIWAIAMGRRRRKSNPFGVGVLTGICILALLCGLCSSGIWQPLVMG
jgi:hypothetical protein